MALITAKELKEKRQNIYEQMQDLYKEAEQRAVEKESDVPVFAQEDNDHYNRLEKRFDDLSKQIEAREKFEKRQSLMDSETGLPLQKSLDTEEQRTDEEIKAEKAEKRSLAFEKYMRKGILGLNEEERSLMEESRTQTVGSDAGGGYTVPDEQASIIEKTLKDYIAMVNVATVIKPGHGRSFFMPSNNDTANKGRIVAESSGDASAGTTDLTFGQIQIDSYKYTSDLIKVSAELLEDNSVGLAQYLAEALSERLGRILNQHSTTGTGTAQPQGIAVGAGAGVTGAVSALTRDDLVDLIHTVDPAYRRNASASFMFNDATLGYIRKLAFGSADDRPLYQVSPIAGVPDTIEGEKFVINPDMAGIGTGNISVLYGALNKYVIRMGRDIQIKRAVERYIENDVVAWVGFMRFDGKLLNSSAVKKLTHA